MNSRKEDLDHIQDDTRKSAVIYGCVGDVDKKGDSICCFFKYKNEILIPDCNRRGSSRVMRS